MTDFTDKTGQSSAADWRTRLARPLLAVLCAGVGALALVHPDTATEAVTFAVGNLVLVSPMIILGIVLTAGITASGSMALITRSLRGRELRMIMVASSIGAITPVCGVTVLPLVAGLLGAGVPLAPIMAFWLSSPVTDPGMLAVTAGTLGLPFAIGKTLAAFAAGILGGAVTLALTRAGYLAAPGRPAMTASFAQPTCSDANQTVEWAFWRYPARWSSFRATAYSTGKLMLIWLTAAFVAEFFLHDLLPPDMLSRFVGTESRFAIPIAALIGAPVYLDGYAALPLIRGLLDGGMAPGAAMAFLIAGGIISAWAAVPVFALVRLPVFGLYVGLAIAGAMIAGWGFAAFAT